MVRCSCRWIAFQGTLDPPSRPTGSRWPCKGKFGARVKDKLERFLHDRVCDGTVRLSKARRAFRDWKAAFKRFGL